MTCLFPDPFLVICHWRVPIEEAGEAILTKRHTTCPTAPKPIRRMKIFRTQPNTGMNHTTPMTIIPVTKGQKKRGAKDSLNPPRSFLPIQSPTYTRLIYIVMMNRRNTITPVGIPITVKQSSRIQHGTATRKTSPIYSQSGTAEK